MRRTLRTAAAAAALGVLLAFAAPAAAMAAEVPASGVKSSTGDPNGDDYWGASNLQSNSKWRKYMLNITGSVLGSAMPNSWQAEQAANNFMAQKSNTNLGLTEEQFNAMMGNRNFSVDVNGNVQQIAQGQGTYDDYVLKQYQDTQAGKGTTKPISPPATKTGALTKTIGGAVSAVGAYSIAAGLTAGGLDHSGSWLGFDANGVVCSATQDDSLGSWAMRTFSGQNCDAFDQASSYIANNDTIGSLTLTFNGVTVTYTGPGGDNRTDQYGTAYPYKYCYSGLPVYTGSGWPGTGYQLQHQILKPPVPDPNTWSPSARGWGGWIFDSWGSVTENGGQYNCTGNTVSLPGLVGGGTYSNYARGPAIRIVSTTTGATVASPVTNHPDPSRTLECDVTYTDGTVATAVGPAYHETDGKMQPPACPPTPTGKTPDKVAVKQKTAGQADQTLSTQDVTPAFKNWLTQYPECATGACLLDLIDVHDPTKGKSCFDTDAGCPDWFDDPNKATDYKCRYGTKTVDLSECYVYSGLWKPGRTAAGSPYSDPTTGVWSGGQNAPDGATKAMSQTVQNPDSVRSCDFSTIEGFDPVGWILRGGQCLMEWTFIPRQGVVDAATAATEESWQGSTPGKIGAAIAGVEPALAALRDGGCGGLALDYPSVGAGWHVAMKTAYLLPACPGDFFAPWAPVFYWFNSLALVFGGLFGVKLQLDRFVNNS